MDGLRDQLRIAWSALWLLGALSCGRAAGAGAPAREVDTPRTVVDSVVPRTVALARFRLGLAEPRELFRGAPNREALVRAFINALERHDTGALGELIIDRAEFAYLYYPTAPEAHPPYDLSPALHWFLLSEESIKGLGRLLHDRGGRPLGYLNHTCDPRPSRQGENTVWGPCVIRRIEASGDTVTERLFGPVIERGGRHKFLSFGNQL
jgi:hypothetical protein